MQENYTIDSGVTTPAVQERPLAFDLAVILLLVALMVVVAGSFAWPWRSTTPPGGAALNQYLPMPDGASWLVAQMDRTGELQEWTSTNVTVLPTFVALAQSLRPAQRNAILTMYPNAIETGLPDVAIVEFRTRRLGVDGLIQEESLLYVREPRGQYLLSLYNAANDLDLLLEPPALVFPTELPSTSSWESSGELARLFDYHFSGRILAVGAYSSDFGSFNDCFQLESRFVVTDGEATASDEVWQEWYCSGVGLVDAVHLDEAKNELARQQLLANANLAPVPAASTLLPPPPDLIDETAPTAVDSWEVSWVGRAAQPGSSAFENSIAPLWIPTAPPILLTAANMGDLVALNVQDALGEVIWRFRPGGAIYGTPAFNPATGLIYFGASDKRLYAVDTNGLFHWAFQTEDNVASRPLITGDTLIFGSEDHTIYALDAQTGRLRWTAVTGGPIVSAAVMLDKLAVIGSDDGGVYALNSETGVLEWMYAVGDAIEAPLVADGDVVYVAARDGNLYALDVEGAELWIGNAGNVLRSAPLVAAGTVYVVDDYGRLHAFDKQTGRRLWVTIEEGYVGPAVLVDSMLIVASEDGHIYRVTNEGVRLPASWDAGSASQPDDSTQPVFRLGPTIGGGALWLADDSAVIRRLGPAVLPGESGN